MAWGEGSGGIWRLDGLAVRGHPPLDPLRASATVVIVKGIQVSKELVA